MKSVFQRTTFKKILSTSTDARHTRKASKAIMWAYSSAPDALQDTTLHSVPNKN